MGPGKNVFLYKPVVFRVHVSFPWGTYIYWVFFHMGPEDRASRPETRASPYMVQMVPGLRETPMESTHG